jgi:circadian clock protein KaiC
MKSRELCKTGIKALDDILNGGIPRGYTILLAGSSGTGKTILTQEILLRGAKIYEENGIYISLSESPKKMLANMENFNYYDSGLIRSGKVKVVELKEEAGLRRRRNPGDPDEILRTIRTLVEENNAKRLVIDSITSICRSLKDEEVIREFIINLADNLDILGCTSILVSEIPPREITYSVFGIEEFVSDGIFLLGEFERKGDLLRTFQIIKMRGVDHPRYKEIMHITRDGINLIPMFKTYGE